MRYGLISTVAAAALSLGAAGALAQQSGSGAAGGSSGQQSPSGAGAAGGSSGQQLRTPTPGTGAQQPGAGMQQGGAAQTQQGTSGQGTSGQASGQAQQGRAGSAETTGSINLSPQQRTQVTRMFSGIRTEPEHVNFNVAVGTVVPTTVTTLHACPSGVARLVSGMPECRYIVVRDKIVLVDPSSRRVVLVLEHRG